MSSGRLGGRAPKAGKPTPGPPPRSIRGARKSRQSQATTASPPDSSASDARGQEGPPAAIVRLRDALLDAYQEYQSRNDSGRLGAMLAVRAATNFLREFGVPPKLRKPFVALVAALNDAQSGKGHPMLAPKKISHRPPQLNSQIHSKAQAAAIVQLLVSHDGRGVPEACSIVAERIQRWNISLPPKKCVINKDTVAHWRSECMETPSSQGGFGSAV